MNAICKGLLVFGAYVTLIFGGIDAHAGSSTSGASSAAAMAAQATAFGQSANPSIFNNINTGTESSSSTGVPNYSNNYSASSYFANGQGNLDTPANSTVSGCVTTTGAQDPNAFTHGQCEAIRMLNNNNPTTNPNPYTIPTTDPLMTTLKNVQTNSASYLGSMSPSGSYTSCVQQQQTTSPQYTDETCVQAYGTSTNACNKLLNVVVTPVSVPGCGAVANSAQGDLLGAFNGGDRNTWITVNCNGPNGFTITTAGWVQLDADYVGWVVTFENSTIYPHIYNNGQAINTPATINVALNTPMTGTATANFNYVGNFVYNWTWDGQSAFTMTYTETCPYLFCFGAPTQISNTWMLPIGTQTENQASSSWDDQCASFETQVAP